MYCDAAPYARSEEIEPTFITMARVEHRIDQDHVLGYGRTAQPSITARVAMISTVTFEDGRGNRWLDFSSAVIPNLGAQIPLPADWDIPFNIFWWGISQAD
jgi:hypothetical protein